MLAWLLCNQQYGQKILLNIYLKLTIQPNTLLLDNQVQTQFEV